jgi:hypothetical protein
MLHRRVLGVIVLVGLALGLAGTIASCSSKSAAGLASNCSINSDCNLPLICAFARCHNQCTASTDCPLGERCVTSGTSGSCQLAGESTCTGMSACQTGQVCGTDMQCREKCIVNASCAMGDFCLPSGTSNACYSTSNMSDEPALIAAHILNADGSLIADAATGGTGPDGSSGGGPDGSSGGGGPDAGAHDGGSSVMGNSCPSAQTQFGNMAQGDSNPSFVSGVGVRAPNALVIFDGYWGSDALSDGGKVNYIYAQSFDPVTANSRGPAQPLLAVPAITGYPVILQAAAVAPTGQIVVLYSSNPDGGVWALFLGESADGGADAGGLQVARTVQLEVSTLSSQPAAFWSVASQAFVFSWQYGGVNGFVKIQKYTATGQSAGGGTDQLPTNYVSSNIGNVGNGYAGASGALLGIPYRNYGGYEAWMTVLDQVGNQVGVTFEMSPTIGNWSTAGGTPAGLVALYDQSGIAGTFVPVSADGGVSATQPIPADSGLDGALPGFHFAGAKVANTARALNDDVGGQQGVGVAILYNDGVAFAYVNADGLTHVGPNDVFAHTYANTDFVNITNYGGSFGVSLYASATHATQMAASGCVTQ